MPKGTDVEWVRYKSNSGPRIKGTKPFKIKRPYGVWSQIIATVAACEGNFDTVVAYDNTGMTFGFLQWTFTSGRLQRLLEFMKSVATVDFRRDDITTLFDAVFIGVDKQVHYQRFEDFGFQINNGKFFGDIRGDRDLVELDPASKSGKAYIVDICMGNLRFDVDHKEERKRHASELASMLAEAGRDLGVQAAQIEFAKMEFKSSLDIKRRPLGKYKTIRTLLEGNLNADEVWVSPIPAIFFNLWQNLPGGAYKLFIKWNSHLEESRGTYAVREATSLLWNMLRTTAIADWGFKSQVYLKNKKDKPRITRLQPALKEFYGVDMPLAE